MLSGRPPFGGKKDAEILEKVKVGVYSMNDPIWKQRSVEAVDLIKKLMERDPARRLSAKQALEHPWIAFKVKEKIDQNLINSAVENLRSFKAEQKLKQASITFMVTHLSTKKEQ